MEGAFMRRLLRALMLVGLTGCHAYSVDVEGRIAERASQPTDVQPGLLPPTMPAEREPVIKEKQAYKTMSDRLKVPEPLPGATTPDIRLPLSNAPRAEIEAAIKKQFPPLPAPPRLPAAQVGPEGRPLALGDLQQIALAANPKIRQAHLDIDAARGVALQAGLYPNPLVGYESSSIGQGDGQGRSAGQQGGFVEQTFKTAGKLKLARSAARMDVQVADQNLKQIESELQMRVRAGYFAVLSARENFAVNKALADLTDEVYNVLVAQLQAGEVAPYEPMQIRVLALQARGQLVLSHNRYVSAWKQLAATLGTPTMPLTELAGRIDMPVPHYEPDSVLAFVLDQHTDVIAAQFGVDKARYLLRLAEAQPFPDVTVHVSVQKDYTTPPFGAIGNVSVGVPFPLWDRNQGNIQAARAHLQRAMRDQERVRNDLTARVADALERYDNNRALLKMYKEQILPNQVQAFRAAILRHDTEPQKVSYNDVVTSQQALATMIGNYLTALSDQWIAVVDIANLVQTKDLFQVQQTDEVAPVPNVLELRHKRR
jgi:cobalt-zinc-cadmium efflux system outer membrane protein